jgi:predicted lactoylglutathione lyase
MKKTSKPKAAAKSNPKKSPAKKAVAKKTTVDFVADQRLSLITLGVENVDHSAAFYESIGWQRSSASMDDMIIFQLSSGMALSLYPRHLLAEDAKVKDSKPGFSGITLAYNTRSEKEVDAMLKQAARSGGTIVKPGQKVFWGGYSGYFRDLDGHLIEVAFNPFWKLDKKGSLILPK